MRVATNASPPVVAVAMASGKIVIHFADAEGEWAELIVEGEPGALLAVGPNGRGLSFGKSPSHFVLFSEEEGLSAVGQRVMARKGEVALLGFAPDYSLVIAYSTGAVNFRRVGDQSFLGENTLVVLDSRPHSMAITDDGSTLVVTDEAGELVAISLTTMKVLYRIPTYPKANVAVSGPASMISVTSTEAYTFRFIDLMSGALLMEVALEDTIFGSFFAPSGEALALLGALNGPVGEAYVVADLGGGVNRPTMVVHSVTGVYADSGVGAFNSTGSHFVVPRDDGVTVFEAGTDPAPVVWESGKGAAGAFFLEGDMLVVVRFDGAVEVVGEGAWTPE